MEMLEHEDGISIVSHICSRSERKVRSSSSMVHPTASSTRLLVNVELTLESEGTLEKHSQACQVFPRQ